MPHNQGNSLFFFFFNTVAEPGLTQVFPVSTSKIQFFSCRRAAPWHQPSWMTQSTKAEHIPMAPLSAHLSLLSACLCSYPVPSPEHQHHRSAWETWSMDISQPHLSRPHLAEEPALCRTPFCPEAWAALNLHVGGVGQPQPWLQAPHPGLGLCKPPQTPALSERLLCLCLDLILNPVGFSLTCKICRLSSGCFWNCRSQITLCFIYIHDGISHQ